MSNNIKFLIERIYRKEWYNEDLTFHDILRIMYIDKNMSMQDISDEIGISIGAVHNFLKSEGSSKNIKCKK